MSGTRVRADYNEEFLKQMEAGKKHVYPRSKIVGLQDYLACLSEEVTEALTKYKKANKLTYVGLARIVEMDASYLERIIKGKRNRLFVSFSVVEPIFDKLDIPLPDIYIRAWVKITDD